MALAIAELERGDGAWENIQTVLRGAFLAHEQHLRRHDERHDSSDGRVSDLEAKWSVANDKLSAVQGLPSHVDKLARVVKKLSEELAECAAAEQEREQQQAQWMASVSRAVETQLDAFHTRIVGDMETVCTKALTAIQRRMDLVEEELGHLAAALDQKADAEVLRTHRQAVDEALKQRCRKAAFDREVVRVHQLLRSQHAQTNEQLEAIEHQLKAQHEQHDQALIDAEKRSEQYQLQRQQTLREELVEDVRKRLQSVEETLERRTEAQIAAAQAAANSYATELVTKQADKLSSRLEERDMRERVALVEHEWRSWRDQTAEVKRALSQQIQAEAETKQELMLQIENVHERLTTSIGNVTDSLNQYKHEQRAIDDTIDKRLGALEEAHRSLQVQIKEMVESAKHQVERTDRLQSLVDQQHVATQEELRDVAKARDKKTRQQMHLVADKLREMDQILKLVGKQLVQNTSQLQLLWIDQHEAVATEDLRLLESEENPIEDGEDVVEDNAIADSNRHHELQATIEAKLRDYEAVLHATTSDTSSPPA